MNLSDRDIWSELHNPLSAFAIDPLEKRDVQPASVDLHLGRHYKRYRDGVHVGPLDPFHLPEEIWQDHHVAEGGCVLLEPKSFLLGRTVERITIPDYMMGRMEGKSSLGRLGLLVHSTAGFFDPGWDGTCTLEMYNFSPRTIRLTAGMKICQMSFGYLNTTCLRPYGHPELGSHYQGQEEATASRYDQQ